MLSLFLIFSYDSRRKSSPIKDRKPFPFPADQQTSAGYKAKRSEAKSAPHNGGSVQWGDARLWKYDVEEGAKGTDGVSPDDTQSNVVSHT